MSKTDVEYFRGEMVFAKVVATDRGDALLIGGEVFHVAGPEGNAALLFAKALRGIGRDDSLALCGALAQAAGASSIGVTN